MAVSVNWNSSFDMMQQSTKKIGVQDWLNRNNFSQASCGFEPLVVHADVHYPGPDLGKNQSDIDEDFVSVSQIGSRKKALSSIKKKNAVDLSNLDVIETYEQSQARDMNDTFDKIFHKGEKMANVIKRTYPGKAKYKLRNTIRALPIENDIFLDESDNNVVNKKSVESNIFNNDKINFSSGSGELWSPMRQNNTQKVLLQRKLSQKICKKYFKNNNSSDKYRVKFNSKKCTQNSLSDKIDQVSIEKISESNKKMLTEVGKYKTKNSICCEKFIADTTDEFSTHVNINNNNNVKSCTTTFSDPQNDRNIRDENNCSNYNSVDLSHTELEKIKNNQPIVLVERLFFKFQSHNMKEKNDIDRVISLSKDSCRTNTTLLKKSEPLLKKIILSDSKKSKSPQNVKENLELKICSKGNVNCDTAVMDNIQTNSSKKKSKLRQNVIKRKGKKYLNSEHNKKINQFDGKNISNSTKSLNILKNTEDYLLDQKSYNNLKEVITPEAVQITNSDRFVNEISKKIKKNSNIIIADKADSRIGCEESTSVSKNDLIQKKKNIKRIQVKKSSSLKLKNESGQDETITPAGDSKKLSGVIFKKVPIVVVKPLKISERKSKEAMDEANPLVSCDDRCKGKVSINSSKAKIEECIDLLQKRNEKSQNFSNSKSEKKLLVTPIKISEQKSPGWSRLESTKKDFRTAQKSKLNVNTSSKLSRSFNKLDSLNSTLGLHFQNRCKNMKDNCEKSPILNSKKSKKQLFHKEEKGPPWCIGLNNLGNRSDKKEQITEILNNSVKNKNILTLQCKVQLEKVNPSKRKSADMVLDSDINNEEQYLMGTRKRRKSAPETLNLKKLSDKTQNTQEQKVPNLLIDTGVQTSPDRYLIHCLLQNCSGNKLQKNYAPLVNNDFDPLLYDSDKVISAPDVCEVINDKSKDSDFYKPVCETASNIQDNNSTSFIMNTEETYFGGITDQSSKKSINDINGDKEINMTFDTLDRDIFSGAKSVEVEKEQNASVDLFSNNSFNEKLHNTSKNCLSISCNPNIFCDRIPFRELNSVGKLSCDFTQSNKYSESILNNKNVLNTGQADKISFTFNSNQCDGLSNLDANQKKFDNLDADQMNDIETVEELYFLCSTCNSGSPDKSMPIDKLEGSTLMSSDFILGTPSAHNQKNNKYSVKNALNFTNAVDNESIVSLSTVKLDDVNSPNITNLSYDVIVSDLCSTTNSNKNLFSSQKPKQSEDFALPIEEIRDTSVCSSESIKPLDEFTIEISENKNKNTTWSQSYIPPSSLTELPYTINSTLLTEVLNTQQQEDLGEECEQLEKQIQAMQEELLNKRR